MWGADLAWKGFALVGYLCRRLCLAEKLVLESSSQKLCSSSFENLAQTLKMSRTGDGQGQFEWGKVPSHLEVVERVLDKTLPDLETSDPTDPREQMAPGQVQAHKLCFQKLTGDSGNPLERLFQGVRLAVSL